VRTAKRIAAAYADNVIEFREARILSSYIWKYQAAHMGSASFPATASLQDLIKFKFSIFYHKIAYDNAVSRYQSSYSIVRLIWVHEGAGIEHFR
jgi:hypothetical protein